MGPRPRHRCTCLHCRTRHRDIGRPDCRRRWQRRRRLLVLHRRPGSHQRHPGGAVDGRLSGVRRSDRPRPCPPDALCRPLDAGCRAERRHGPATDCNRICRHRRFRPLGLGRRHRAIARDRQRFLDLWTRRRPHRPHAAQCPARRPYLPRCHRLRRHRAMAPRRAARNAPGCRLPLHRLAGAPARNRRDRRTDLPRLLHQLRHRPRPRRRPPRFRRSKLRSSRPSASKPTSARRRCCRSCRSRSAWRCCFR